MCESSSTEDNKHEPKKNKSQGSLVSDVGILEKVEADISVTDDLGKELPKETVISYQDLIINNKHRNLGNIALPMDMKSTLNEYISYLDKPTNDEIRIGVDGIRVLLDNILAQLSQPYNENTLIHQSYGSFIIKKFQIFHSCCIITCCVEMHQTNKRVSDRL